MKLCIQNLSRVWGGNEKWMGLLAEGLQRGGHQVVVSCRAGSAVETRLRETGIATTPVRPGALGQLPRGVAFARWLARERPEALLLTSWRGIPWGSWAGRRAGARVVVRLGIRRAAHRLHPASLAMRWVDAMIVNAAEIRDAWLASGAGVPREGIQVVHNAVIGGILAEEARREVRLALGMHEGLWLGCAGFIERRKGVDLLLEALAAVPHARLVVIGDGSQVEALRGQAESLGIGQRVLWAGYRPDARRLLAACDLVVVPSRNEGMANVILEAMGGGVPVVASEVSGTRAALGEIPGHPAAGWIVPVEDVAALAAALRAALGDAGERARRGAEGARRASEWFSETRMLRECEAILFPGTQAARPARDI